MSGDLHLGFLLPFTHFSILSQEVISIVPVRLVRISVLDKDSKAQMCGRSYWNHVFGVVKAEVVSIFCEATPPASQVPPPTSSSGSFNEK